MATMDNNNMILKHISKLFDGSNCK